jgi:putative transposase
MKGKRFTEEQIIGVLKQADAGIPTADLCRQHGINKNTLYNWKKKFGGMDVNEAKRMRQLEDENRRLKHIVADLTLDNSMLKEVLSKKW